MSLLHDYFYDTRETVTPVFSIKTTLEVVPVEGDTVRVNIIVDEDPFNVLGRPGSITFSALTTVEFLLHSGAHFNLDLNHALLDWEVRDAE
jgi:hypothetical protein